MFLSISIWRYMQMCSQIMYTAECMLQHKHTCTKVKKKNNKPCTYHWRPGTPNSSMKHPSTMKPVAGLAPARSAPNPNLGSPGIVAVKKARGVVTPWRGGGAYSPRRGRRSPPALLWESDTVTNSAAGSSPLSQSQLRSALWPPATEARGTSRRRVRLPA